MSNRLHLNLTHMTSTAHPDVSPKLWLHEASTPPTHIASNQTKLSNLQDLLTGATSHQRGLEAPPLHVAANRNRKDAGSTTAKLSLVAQWLEEHKMPPEKLEAYRREHPPLTEAEKRSDENGLNIATQIFTLALPIGMALGGITKTVKGLQSAKAISSAAALRMPPEAATIIRGYKVSNFSTTRNITVQNAPAQWARLEAEFAARLTQLKNLNLPDADFVRAQSKLSRELTKARRALDDQLLSMGHTISSVRDRTISEPTWNELRAKWIASIQRSSNTKGQAPEPDLITSATTSRYNTGASAENINDRIAAAEGMVTRSRAAYLELAKKLGETKAANRSATGNAASSATEAKLRSELDQTQAILEGAEKALDTLYIHRIAIEQAARSGAPRPLLSTALESAK